MIEGFASAIPAFSSVRSALRALLPFPSVGLALRRYGPQSKVFSVSGSNSRILPDSIESVSLSPCLTPLSAETLATIISSKAVSGL